METGGENSALRIVLVGSVGSSRRILEGLVRNRAQVVGVFGLSKTASVNISGYARLDDICIRESIPYWDFERVNEPWIVDLVATLKPDLIFAVGLSQLLGSKMLSIPRLGCVGFHPTRLPRGRGRAPLAWLILNREPGAATFFFMDEGSDSGPILAQEPFDVSDSDYASDVGRKIDMSIDKALDSWLPRLMAGEWDPRFQNEEDATYWGKRVPSDGLIDWHKAATDIELLVRAASRPHPGAFTFVNGARLVIWRARLDTAARIHGVVGSVVDISESGALLVQTGNGLIWLTEWEVCPFEGETTPRVRLGSRLGFVLECEIETLRRKVTSLEAQMADLKRKLSTRVKEAESGECDGNCSSPGR